MSDSKYGIKETSDLVIFLSMATSTIIRASGDGLTLTDLSDGLTLLDEAKDAFVGIQEIPKEIRDLEGDELAELVKLVGEKLDLPGERAEEIIRASLGMAPSLLELVKTLTGGDDEADAAESKPA